MATPSSSSSALDPVPAPPSSTSSQPTKSLLLPSSSIPSSLRPSPPPIFAAQTLLGKPLNPPPPPPPPHAILYHRSGLSGRSAPGRPQLASDHIVTVANPAGYIRNSSPTAVMTFAGSQARPFVFGTGDHTAQMHAMRPPQFMVPRQIGASPGPPKSGSGTGQPKVASFPTLCLGPEQKHSKERDKCREDTIVVIHDRKVRLLEGGSGSLYALCRSWVRNGLPEESQTNIGEGLKLLPKPLPALVTGSDALQKIVDTIKDEFSDKREDNGAIEQLPEHELLGRHVKRAKRARELWKEHQAQRIDRYKHRLSLLLPSPGELLGRSETATPVSSYRQMFGTLPPNTTN